MAADVDIANLALGYLGDAMIASLDDDSTEAKLAKRFFWPTADEVLAEHPWHFATIWSPALAIVAGVTSPDFSYYFALPTDPYCLVVRGTDADDSKEPWRVEGRRIGLSLSTLKIFYTARITDVSTWSPAFVTAMSYCLASKLAYPLTESMHVTEDMLKLYSGRMAMGRSNNAREAPARTVRSTTLTTDVR